MLNIKSDIINNERLVFDDAHASFIHSIVRLKGKCLFLHEVALTDLKEHLEENFGGDATFYSDMSDAINCMIVYLLNEEVSNMSGRPYLPDILINASSKNFPPTVDEDEKFYIPMAHNEIKEIFIGKINEITRSYFVDFTISTFSAFEKWMCKIYPISRKNIPSKDSKKKKLTCLIKKFQNTQDETERDEILHNIMNNFSSYVSSAEMIEFVLTAAKDKYQRNIAKDKNTIRFYAARRNTIHNFGVHERESLNPITLNGRKISLEQGCGAFTDDFRAVVDHCEELVDIYTATVKSIRIPEWGLYFESRKFR